jgi:hypothetical protein
MASLPSDVGLRRQVLADLVAVVHLFASPSVAKDVRLCECRLLQHLAAQTEFSELLAISTHEHVTG